MGEAGVLDDEEDEAEVGTIGLGTASLRSRLGRRETRSGSGGVNLSSPNLIP